MKRIDGCAFAGLWNVVQSETKDDISLVLLGPFKGTIAALSHIAMALLLQVAPFSKIKRT